MATTGTELSKIFDQKIGQSYTGYLDNTKKNRLFKEALFTSIENKYKILADQKSRDELFKIIRTEVTATPTSNTLYLSGAVSPVIADYMHLLAIKVKYKKILQNVSIIGATNKSPIVVSTDNRNILRSNDLIYITGVAGNTNANGYRYIRLVTPTSFALYTDIYLTTPVAGNADYVSGGQIEIVSYEYAKPLYSDRKIGVFGQPSVVNPKYEIADGLLKLYPLEEVAIEATLDYISKASVIIDVADNATDLELTYPIKFLYYIMDIAKGMFAEQVRDDSLYQMSSLDTNKNT